jgi:hypothetical protein
VHGTHVGTPRAPSSPPHRPVASFARVRARTISVARRARSRANVGKTKSPGGLITSGAVVVPNQWRRTSAAEGSPRRSIRYRPDTRRWNLRTSPLRDRTTCRG